MEIDWDAAIAGAGDSGIRREDLPTDQLKELDEKSGHARLEERRELTGLRTQHEDLLSKVKELELRLPIDDLTGLVRLQSGVTRETIIPRILDEAASHRHGVAYIDIDADKFKHINDTYDKGTGDIVIMFFAEALKRSCRKDGSDLPMRTFSGDEFGIILVDESAPAELAKQMVLRIRENLQAVIEESYADNPYMPAELRSMISFSAGITIMRQEGVSSRAAAETFEKIKERGETQTAKAKAAGRGLCAVEGEDNLF